MLNALAEGRLAFCSVPLQHLMRPLAFHGDHHVKDLPQVRDKFPIIRYHESRPVQIRGHHRQDGVDSTGHEKRTSNAREHLAGLSY